MIIIIYSTKIASLPSVTRTLIGVVTGIEIKWLKAWNLVKRNLEIVYKSVHIFIATLNVGSTYLQELYFFIINIVRGPLT